MAKTLVDVDPDLLTEVATILGTKTKKDTINAALAAIVAREKLNRHLEFLASGGLPDLSDPDVMKGAWR